MFAIFCLLCHILWYRRDGLVESCDSKCETDCWCQLVWWKIVDSGV